MGIFSDVLKRGVEGVVRKEDQNVESLMLFLKTGIVEFEYYKVYRFKKSETYDPTKHGKLRNAIGTYDLDRVSEAGFKFAGGECIPKETAGAETYWDLEKNAWRVFYPRNFVRIVRLINPDELSSVLAQREAEREAEKAKGYTVKDN